MGAPLLCYLHCEGEGMCLPCLLLKEGCRLSFRVNEHWLPGLMWGLSSCMEAARGSGIDPDCSVTHCRTHTGAGHLPASVLPWLLLHLSTRPWASS